jgi:predicted nucleotide-binding protein
MINKEKLKAAIESLSKRASFFNRDNFSHYNGIYIGDPSTELKEWRDRIKSLLDRNVVADSAPLKYYEKAIIYSKRGLDRDFWAVAISAYVQALSAFESIIDEGDLFDELLYKAILDEGGEEISIVKPDSITTDKKKVFIVHGHDHMLKTELEIFLSRLKLEPIVLHREVDGGQTIIEKFEANSDVSFVFVLLTPDEIAHTVDQAELEEKERVKEFRARPNVIFEFGYFVGKMGRKKVCALYKENVSLPSDLSGVIYKRVEKTIEDIGFALIKELKAAGVEIVI